MMKIKIFVTQRRVILSLLSNLYRELPVVVWSIHRMTMRIVHFIFSLSILTSPIFSQQGEALPTVAVLDFEARGISMVEAQSLTDRFRSSTGNTGAVRLVERGMMEEVLQEQGFQQTGCISEECVVEVGQLLGVESIVSIQSRGKVQDQTLGLKRISPGAPYLF